MNVYLSVSIIISVLAIILFLQMAIKNKDKFLKKEILPTIAECISEVGSILSIKLPSIIDIVISRIEEVPSFKNANIADLLELDEFDLFITEVSEEMFNNVLSTFIPATILDTIYKTKIDEYCINLIKNGIINFLSGFTVLSVAKQVNNETIQKLNGIIDEALVEMDNMQYVLFDIENIPNQIDEILDIIDDLVEYFNAVNKESNLVKEKGLLTLKDITDIQANIDDLNIQLEKIKDVIK